VRAAITRGSHQGVIGKLTKQRLYRVDSALAYDITFDIFCDGAVECAGIAGTEKISK
jgi:hypothetical protein